ncbi:hypothetical protein ARAM_005049 [Aspergillus rambellii]|uniref:tRNA wybutosine-synthesizing protein 2 n=1 Tax=Aspergillus rambellii TaxID=308745 RepID=A0A0F8UTC1_9EURO|nr:hypothetical protein ARAM_005049 [Aspergillus rambellii]
MENASPCQIRPKRTPKKNLNPLQKGIREFVTNHLPPSLLSQYDLSLEALVSSFPKRYTVYEPMLLLPLNAFTHPPAWGSLYESLSNEQRQHLYGSIVDSFGSMGVTHVAINAPIVPLDSRGEENRMRSPVGLVPLHGVFGCTPSEDGGNDRPSETDYGQSFWVKTVQNHGIVQIWAPLYTMFSRGNITEKARILGHGSVFEGLDDASLGESIKDIAVVDMLRRGCVENGWGCKVFEVKNSGQLNVPISEVVDGLRDSDRVVIFHGDNQFAARILSEIQMIMESRKVWNNIRHVNLGLLPSSSFSWENACKVMDKSRGGWVHVHENVHTQEIDKKMGEIVGNIEEFWTQSLPKCNDLRPRTNCLHVEQVKTYAPGVMHCVFDIRLSPYESLDIGVS